MSLAVIDDDYDTSLSISWDEVEARIKRQCSFAVKCHQRRRPEITIPISTTYKSAMKDHGIVFPKYCPPSLANDMGARAVYLAFNYDSPPPKEPKLPVAKTNTQLLNYVHRLYVFKAYKLEQQWRLQQAMEDNKYSHPTKATKPSSRPKPAKKLRFNLH